MKFGILGEAKIAREHVVPAILAAGHEVTHVGRSCLLYTSPSPRDS